MRLPSITPVQQFVRLRRNEVFGGDGEVIRNKLVWRYLRQPSIYSRRYLMRVTMLAGEAPEIFVDDPDLKLLADGRKLPHVYAQRPPQLCLYLPGTGEWTPSSFIDQTIMPWADVWLFYYEEWLFSDDWKGGGMHPSGENAGSRRARRRISRSYG